VGIKASLYLLIPFKAKYEQRCNARISHCNGSDKHNITSIKEWNVDIKEKVHESKHGQGNSNDAKQEHQSFGEAQLQHGKYLAYL
jgi:hypothetical protein